MKSLLVISDTHSNSTVGLAKPTVQLDDGDAVHASTVRRWLFHTWEDILSKAEAKAKQYGSELYGLINGDAVETDAKSRTFQIISRNNVTAVGIAIEVFEPMFAMCKGVYVVRGTEAHVGAQAQAEEALAQNFTNTIRNDETGNYSWSWLPLELDGVRMDICHHPRGAGSGSPTLAQNGINRMAANTLFEYANEGLLPPHLVIRSHLHGYRDSKDTFRTRAIITPPMSLLTSYTNRIGINISAPVGALLITCDAGRYHVEPLLYPVRRPEWQAL